MSKKVWQGFFYTKSAHFCAPSTDRNYIKMGEGIFGIMKKSPRNKS